MAFTNTLLQWLGEVPNNTLSRTMRRVIAPLFDRESSCALNSAGLVIKAGGSAIVKSGATDCYLVANGILQKVAASTDMPALVGSVTNAKFNVYCFFIDSAGVKTSAMGTEGSTLAKVVCPPFPTYKALIGFIVINPTGTGPFVGGTTALDDATVVPTAAYISAIGGFDPAMLIGAQ